MILPRLGPIAAAVSSSAGHLPSLSDLPPNLDPARDLATSFVLATSAQTTVMARGDAPLLAAAALAALTSLLCLAAYSEGLRRGAERCRGADGPENGDVPPPTTTTTGEGTESKDGSAGDAVSRPATEARSGREDAEGAPPSAPPPAPLPIRPIGTLNSVYRLCVGTPRQGMLAPSSRGVVTFDETLVSRDAVLELGEYSHVYVLFEFHLNSNSGAVAGSFAGKGGKRRQFPSKIAPPSLGGRKVGVFGTRTPHRPNPVGFSLCRLDKVVVGPKKKGKTGGPTFRLLVSGLDIVDGTPVLDVKPYVPHYDCVGYDPGSGRVAAADGGGATDGKKVREGTGPPADEVRVPAWVDDGLKKRRTVSLLPAAEDFLSSLPDGALKFYGPGSPWKDRREDTPAAAKGCIREVLGADVRSAWQTRKARGGRSQAERSGRLGGRGGKKGDGDGSAGDGVRAEEGLCSQQIDNMLVQYAIEEPGGEGGEGARGVDERSRGSGAEDRVVVHSISLIR